LRAETERGWLRLAFLQLDGRALAFDYCLEYDKIHYVLKTGYDPAFERFSPGKVLRHLMLARAFSEGLASYELLGFFAPWKQKWTEAYRELQFLHIFAPTGLGLLDQATFVGVSSVSRRTQSLVHSTIFPEHGRRLLKQAHTEWHRKLDRKHTS
jgi:CelD/BcsL family acetyltransferase involved in cellulose biosynthesis